MIIGASEIDKHITVAVVETHTMNEAASADISAHEWFQIGLARDTSHQLARPSQESR
jgi:hypothetical protein